jgi:hypothetical protein
MGLRDDADKEQLSDTLLSILAIRGGELVQSMFGNDTSAPSSGSISPA